MTGTVSPLSQQVKIQALDFSHDERFLASLGGQDDNSLVSDDLAPVGFHDLHAESVTLQEEPGHGGVALASL